MPPLPQDAVFSALYPLFWATPSYSIGIVILLEPLKVSSTVTFDFALMESGVARGIK